MRRRPAFAPALVLFSALALFPGPLSAQRGGGPPAAPPPGPLKFEFVGPSDGGRISAVVGIPGQPGTYYAGAASGGIWKSTDGGAQWAPIFDDQPVAAIGTLAVAPSNPQIVWAGTGEAWAIRDADVMGDGVYKSTDGGATWTNMGLRESGRVGRILVHPTDANTVWVCALGRSTGPQQEKGVYKSTDGGATWQRSFFVDANTGCSGLAMDPADPNVLFAGMWQMEMHTWAMFSGGPSSGVWVTRDGGRRWSRLSRGLPKSPVGKVDVAIAPSDRNRVYALIQTPDQGSLWRSDDGGNAWQVVSWDRTLIGRAGYYIRLLVSPANPDEILVASSSMHLSTDGGKTFTTAGGCGDCHEIWWDPRNADHFALTGDGGMSITLDHGRTRTNVSLPIGQMYHVAIDNRIPYWVYSNRQDNGTMRGPGNAPELPDNVPSYLPPRPQGGRGGGFGGGFGGGRGGGPAWDHGIGGCESGFTIPDPTNPDIVWATCYGNKVTRYDARRDQARSVQPWMQTLDSPPDDAKYRCHWTPPLAIDPFDPNTVYYGCQVIFRTQNGGQSWTVISPDLSTNDPSRIVSSGGVIGDNLGQFYGEVVFAIAPSEIQRGLVWAGTNDGKVWYTRDGGADWTDVTANITGMPVWGTIRQIWPSTFDASTAYIAVDYHLMDDRRPYIWKTTDLGRTWTRVNGDLPSDHPLDYVLSVVENPNRRGMLFAGTGHAFYYSMDDGAHWTQLQEGLPPAPVTWIVPARVHHDVVVSTYGRGLWILRDITRLEQADKVAGADVYVYEPRPGFRYARNGTAEFLYQVRSAPRDSVKVEILDAGGSVIRTFNATGRAGLNRAIWDLRYETPTQVELRTLAPDNPFIWDEPRFAGRDTRPVTHWGIAGAQRAGPLAAPGGYTVRMTIDGQTHSRPFQVVKDPKIPSSDADLLASTQAQIRIRDGMNASADVANRIEIMRKQIEDHLAANRGNRGLERSLRELDQKMLDVELQILSRSDLHSDDKWFVEAYRVYLNLIWLNGEVGTGASDVAGGADYRPTEQSMAVLQLIEADLAKAKADFETLMRETVPAFNRSMEGRLPPITDRLPPKTTT